MFVLADQCILLLLALCSMPLINNTTLSVIGCLSAVIQFSYQYFFKKLTFSYIFVGCYLVVCIFLPNLLYFSPIMFYELLYPLRRYGIPYLIFALVLALVTLPLTGILYFVGCLGICFYFRYKSVVHQTLYDEYLEVRDESHYQNTLLQEKNTSLLEKQDYELYAATLKERNRIAREIHDNVGHMLSRSILLMGALKTINQQEAIAEPLLQLEDTLQTAMNNVRQSVHDLHDESVDLKVVLESILTTFTHCDIDFDYDITSKLQREWKYSIISITKEALSNIIKHSNATKVTLTLREHPSFLQFVISDNGTNQEKATTYKQSGIGLLNMQERIEQLHGNMKVTTNQGFRIFITIPKEFT